MLSLKDNLESRLDINPDITPVLIQGKGKFCSPGSTAEYSFLSPSSGSPPPPAQALPPGVMQQLPKRQILEKSNGTASAIFNPSMFHYQQALANMQLQQQAFIPAGESPHTSASVQCERLEEMNHYGLLILDLNMSWTNKHTGYWC